MIKYLICSKEEFYEFIENIKPEDNIAILTHTDLDGISSGIFLEEILKSKNLKIKIIRFINYKKDLFSSLIKNLEKEKISKIFISDIGSDDPKDLENLREKFDVFWIDHHEFSKIENRKNIIKTESADCVGFVIYDLAEKFIDQEKWNWLVCATMVSEFSFKRKENLDFIKKYYNMNFENPFDSEPGEIAKRVSSALMYYKKDLKKVYKMVQNNDIDQIEEIHKIVQKEIDLVVDYYWKNAEYFPKQGIYICEINPKIAGPSVVSTIVSQAKPEDTHLIINNMGEEFVKISARNQSDKKDMNKLVKLGIEGLKDSTGGGHPNASGAIIKREDLEEFKDKILTGNP